MKNSETKKIHPFEVSQVRGSFNTAVASYDEAAVLQREIGDRLIDKLDFIKLQPKIILEVGSGTGYCTAQLKKLYPNSDIIALDIADLMLKATKNKLSFLQKIRKQISFICADATHLPFQNNSIDFIFSNLTLQWCPELDVVFKEFYRVLQPNGLLMFSSFGPDSLKELRSAWSEVDSFSHVNNFVDMHDVGDDMLAAKLADPVLDMEMLTLTYKNIFDLMRDLKNVGAHNINQSRNHGLTGKGQIEKLKQAYEQFRVEGQLPLSYEVVYGHAWIAPNKVEAHNIASILLNEIK
ncbi:Malonyl-[acyl-carrier protein] O-methyltransferase [hydrothermal vent metagenome]|uniref:malonyl-[acyl-carrier protein] O-methyltransferase n=1 Tax=hydrothermal vent metagenome TaxID=652676 RepID=A0A3B1B9A1_9ZZZZ